MTYTELERLRHELSVRTNHTWEKYAALAGQVLSKRDIDLLRTSMVRTCWGLQRQSSDGVWEGDNAGKAALALLTRAGYCDLASDIRPWLIGSQDDGDQIYTTGPHVLYQIVVACNDGNALRVLLEGVESGNKDVQLNLSRVLDELGDGAMELLKMSRKTQVATILDRDATDRRLSILKSFVQEDAVRYFLACEARKGRLNALLSFLCRDELLEWSLFDNITVEDDYEAQTLLNAMIENVRRGASPDYCAKAPSLQRFSMMEELAEGLAIVRA